ncbi:hypothetical protein U8527_16085 [Kordia algicida OT-1]|uniref:Uncharacterized protein n=1 Tax=Kordia algicida OT-1 TaxID=391587 RepID=A9E4A8_9FLAO|nr:hypothetical protein [Kordia algicida]EDP95341.1 hypothetical protein KAOT1_09721 [Kordia algicida OT-1]
MDTIFNYTYEILIWLANLTGFSYKEINIIIWFILIPLSWMLLLDKIYRQRKFTIIFSLLIAILLIAIPDFTRFCNWLFQKSVDFLNTFNTLGSNYVASSVIICVLIPIVIYVILIKKAFFKQNENHAL